MSASGSFVVIASIALGACLAVAGCNQRGERVGVPLKKGDRISDFEDCSKAEGLHDVLDVHGEWARLKNYSGKVAWRYMPEAFGRLVICE